MNLIGEKFGRLTILEKIVIKWRTRYKCVCECGNQTIVYKQSLMSGTTKSCGCLQREKASEVFSIANYKHGNRIKKSKVYVAWDNMKSRCYNKNNSDYHRYGGRGIKVCDRWLESFENFLEDIGKAPGKEYSIDRIDNNGNYEPSNVKWSTDEEQKNNRECSRKILI